MRKIFQTLLVATLGTVFLVAVPVTASAAEGKVVVFETELNELTTYIDPEGCQKLPPLAHVLVNDTDSPVRIYADPFCLTPSLKVRPGYGSHVAPMSGSFSA
ncbi:hypothetical protein [Amycolatopsis sp. CA-230715]|uniref:hypothetical protein n=1 Tax=Amycolatopsis sp. CA-230715 TaxID=2745196 RepID=UPI001C34127B|nr:hypothetical protein [Amycolatopsis sp. CA-230715]QWF83839.1 hypothetical protein HUW46_07282 [Amycolatopsis sp. CA-230715]